MNVMLYINTLRYLKTVQLFGRLVHTINRPFKSISPEFSGKPERIHISIARLDCDDEYIARLAPEALLENRICLLHHERTLSFSEDNLSGEAPLWKYNLQYFEFAVALAARFQQTKDYAYISAFDKSLSDFLNAGIHQKSYVVSLRIVNLLISADLIWDDIDSGLQKKIYDCVYRDYCFLKENTEVYLLGNHYFENLKSLCIAALVFGEEKEHNKYLKLLQKQIHEQFLPDGMHFELSPMYHNVLLEGLLRVILCLKQYRDVPSWLLDYTQKALSAAAFLEKGFDRIPLFNDSGNNVAKPFIQLQSAAKGVLGQSPRSIDRLASAGYYRLENGLLTLLFDAGKIGPDYMPGHGHCDCLSFELSIKGSPLFVNSGTYQYQGKLRSYFRSTRAHNTLMIGEKEQSECWGEHRVARRVNNISVEMDAGRITASCKNYFGDTHRRSISLANNTLTVLDATETQRADVIHSYLHIADNYSVRTGDSSLFVNKNDVTVCEIHPENATVAIHEIGELTQYAPEFGQLLHSACIEFTWKSDNAQHGYSVNFNIMGIKND